MPHADGSIVFARNDQAGAPRELVEMGDGPDTSEIHPIEQLGEEQCGIKQEARGSVGSPPGSAEAPVARPGPSPQVAAPAPPQPARPPVALLRSSHTPPSTPTTC